jgi:hypothetical protein
MSTSSVANIVESTKLQMANITGLKYDTISQFDPSENGWKMVIDMLEYRSIPRTQDLLSTFEVVLDTDGSVIRWKRTGRFTRGEKG